MNLTFGGFLKGYCRELSGQHSLALRRLVELAVGERPRLAEPLFAFAADMGNTEYLLRLTRGTRLEYEYAKLADEARRAGSIESYAASPSAPKRMRSVWDAYQSKKHAADPSRRIIALMRPAIVDGLGAASLSVYRMCKDLGLNKGNVYAYLNAGDATKVSKATADRMLAYATKAST